MRFPHGSDGVALTWGRLCASCAAVQRLNKGSRCCTLHLSRARVCEPSAVACPLKADSLKRGARPQKTPLPYTHPNSGPRLRVLKALQEKPDITQRELAARLGVSLGQVNYCVKALVDKGHVKVGNFAASSNKLGYVYLLTPSGLAEKSRLTAAFIERKLSEYKALHAEIIALVEAGELPPEELPGPLLGESR